MYLATSVDFGQTFSMAQKLGAGEWKLNACPMDGGGIAVSASGSWQAVWRREHTVYLSTKETPERRLADQASQAVVGFVGEMPIMLWEQDGALMLQRDGASPRRLADSAGAASMACGPRSAMVVWESTTTGPKRILFASLPDGKSD
jgi:hypothetical protein